MHGWLIPFWDGGHRLQWNIIQPKKKEIVPFVAAYVDLQGTMLS